VKPEAIACERMSQDGVQEKKNRKKWRAEEERHKGLLGPVLKKHWVEA
jgi:hypothetical protein